MSDELILKIVQQLDKKRDFIPKLQDNYAPGLPEEQINKIVQELSDPDLVISPQNAEEELLLIKVLNRKLEEGKIKAEMTNDVDKKTAQELLPLIEALPDHDKKIDWGGFSEHFDFGVYVFSKTTQEEELKDFQKMRKMYESSPKFLDTLSQKIYIDEDSKELDGEGRTHDQVCRAGTSQGEDCPTCGKLVKNIFGDIRTCQGCSKNNSPNKQQFQNFLSTLAQLQQYFTANSIHSITKLSETSTLMEPEQKRKNKMDKQELEQEINKLKTQTEQNPNKPVWP
ncbi:13319_t:CDS:2 [Entrophospora sp. SA101]|nr:11499_t:CDS:2 [Entrophospora sp. SA101]CAJ0899572.1 13319_t:CDS:2 [Entrophospora sp. SA101]